MQSSPYRVLDPVSDDQKLPMWMKKSSYNSQTFNLYVFVALGILMYVHLSI